MAHRRVVAYQDGAATYDLGDGAVVIAAITSCTNTSNPSVLVAAGLLAKKAVARGLRPKPWVKTTMAPGSKVVTDYLAKAGLTPYLEKLGFYLVGYGCTTCIGNSGPLADPIAKAVTDNDLIVCSVLSGNRNFEGRVHPQVRANYLASPPLVVAFALAGSMDWDPINEPIGRDGNGVDVYMRDLWPTSAEIGATVAECVAEAMFRREYADAFGGDERWKSLEIQEGTRFAWAPGSTYVKRPPFFDGMPVEPAPRADITGARVLAVLGDSVTTDHISPAGSIGKDSPAGAYLIARGIEHKDFNSYGARRGNHEVMMRGTFANIRLRNELTPGLEGWWTRLASGAEPTSFFDAATAYAKSATPLVVIAGKEYGTGSSRDWAAKGTMLLGVRAVIAESFERIHRSNLVGMGVLPLEFVEGATRLSLGLTGFESYSIEGLTDAMAARAILTVKAESESGGAKTFKVRSRIDTPEELNYYKHGGILPYVLRNLAR
jgi:aconitate hydratase